MLKVGVTCPRAGIPVKEGLRQRLKGCTGGELHEPRTGIPLEEGLRLCIVVFIYFPVCARVGIPVKEGLRKVLLIVTAVLVQPRLGIPTKEGLRRVPVHLVEPFFVTQSGYSIKRRIKTSWLRSYSFRLASPEKVFH